MGGLKRGWERAAAPYALACCLAALAAAGCTNSLMDSVKKVTTEYVARQSAPETPTRPSVTAADSQLTVQWAAVPGALAYHVALQTSDDPSAITDAAISPASGLSATLAGLANGLTYYVWVRASNTVGTGPWSPSASGMPVEAGSAPAAPAKPQLQARNQSIEVSWTAVADATGYLVYWSEQSDSTTVPTGNEKESTDPTCTIDGLTNGTIYYVWVKATNAKGPSGFSLYASATPLDPPSPPALPTLTALDGRLDLGWTTVTGASGYEVLWSTTNDPASADASHRHSVTAPVVGDSIQGLSNGTIYFVWIVATNAAGSSGPSPVAFASPIPAPAAPAAPSLVPSDSQVSVSWSAVAGASSYEVSWSTTDSAASILSANRKTATGTFSAVSSLVNGTEYWFWVRASNSAGTSDYGPSDSATPVAAITLPASPAAPTLAAGDGRIQVSWAAVPSAASYKVGWSESPDPQTAIALGTTALVPSGLSMTIPQLPLATIHYVWVRAVNTFGEGPWSPAAGAKTIATPSPPLAARASHGFSLSWTAVAGATSYDILFSTLDDVTSVASEDTRNLVSVASAGSTVSTSVTGLPSGTSYHVWIRARNNLRGASDSSTPSVAVTTKSVPTLSVAELSVDYGTAPFPLQLTSDSAGACSFESFAPSVATIATDGTVTVRGAGSCVLRVTQAATADFDEAVATTTLTVKPILPSLGPLAIPTKDFGSDPFSLTPPTSDSPGSWSWSINDNSIADIVGNTVTIFKVGQTIITATQAAAGNYTETSKTTSLSVLSIPPTLSWNDLARLYRDPPFALSPPSSNSDGSFAYTSATPSVATVSGSTVTVAGAGTSVITATQAAAGNYSQGSVTMVLSVGRIDPVLGFPAVTKAYGDPAFTIAQPSSDSPGTFVYLSSNPAVATIGATTGMVAILNVGWTDITATQAETSNYFSKAVTTRLTVNQSGAATFGTFLIPARDYGTPAFTVAAPSSNSSGAFTFSSGDPSVATIGVSSGLVTILKAGFTDITATQAETVNFASGSVTTRFVVDPATPALGSLILPVQTFGSGSFTPTPPSSPSSGAWSYSSGDPAVATGSGSTITIVGAGSCLITATQAALGNYASASTTAILTVGKRTPVLGAFSIAARDYGTAPFAIAAPSSDSGGGWSFSSDNTAVASLSGSGSAWTLTVTGAGACVITATQASTANYTGAMATATFTVSPITPTLGNFPNLSKSFGAAFSLAAPSSNSAGPFSYSSSDPSVATVLGAVVTPVRSGTSTITATQAAAGSYLSGSISALLTVNPVLPTVTTLAVSTASPTTATGGGSISGDGGATISGRGLCWGTSTDPTTAGSHSSDGTGTGSYASALSGLLRGTLYHARAYATNAAGTAYGPEVSFTTPVTISFDAQGGTAPSPSTILATPGEAYGGLATTSRTGYVFGGWFTGTEGSGTQVTPPTTVFVTSDQTLFAKWIPGQYTVSFDAQGGTAPSPATKTATYDAQYGALATTSRTGYDFGGWYKETGFTNLVVDTTTVSSASNHTLYAKWTAKNYTVTFDAQGGTVSPASKSVTFDSTYGTLPTPTYGSLTFAGWWTGALGGGSQVQSTSTVSITASQTLYAKWTTTVTFDAQGGSTPSPASITVIKGSTYGTLATTSYASLTFGGWYTGTLGTGSQISSGSTVAITAPQTLYAKWTTTVTFDAQGGSAPSPASITVIKGSTYGTLATTSYSSLTLGGWYTGTLGTGSQITSGSTVAITAPQTLYAKWTTTVSFDAQGGSTPSPTSITVIKGSTYGTLATTSFGSLTLGGWYTGTLGTGSQITSASTVAITAPQTLYAKWTTTVTFDAQGGSAPSPASITVIKGSTYGTLATSTKAGYDLAGWYTGTLGTGSQVTSGSTVNTTAPQTLYAYWTPKSFTVSFDAQGGTVSPVSKSVTFDSTYGTLPTPSYGSLSFAGWWTGTLGGGSQVQSTTTVSITANQTIYAKWTTTVTFNAQGGSTPSPTSITVIKGSTYGTLATTSYASLTLGGWYTGTLGTGSQITSASTVAITAPQTLYAKWTTTVSFDAQGGSAPSPASITVIKGSTYGTLATTTRVGYDLAGWYTGTLGTGSQVTSGSTVNTTASQTIYAYWTPESFTVSFDAQGGSPPSPTSLMVAYNSTYGTLATTTRAGYDFNGWYTETSGTGSLVTSASIVTIAAPHTLYAFWTPTLFTIQYAPNGATAGSPPPTMMHPYESIHTIQRPLPFFERVNDGGVSYRFVCWNDSPMGFGIDYYPDMPWMVVSNLTLYAKWAPYVLRDVGPAGGYIFFDRGFYGGMPSWRYLEASQADVEFGTWVAWSGPGTYTQIVGTGTVIGDGNPNTNNISGFWNASAQAAWLCYSLVTSGGYDDWFLPSRDELVLMYENLRAYEISTWQPEWYWCSSESGNSTAFAVLFAQFSGNWQTMGKDFPLPIRAARAF